MIIKSTVRFNKLFKLELIILIPIADRLILSMKKKYIQSFCVEWLYYKIKYCLFSRDPLFIKLIAIILGDPGVDSGDEDKSGAGEKNCLAKVRRKK